MTLCPILSAARHETLSAQLGRSIGQLDEPGLLVVVGECSSGKGALINALTGRPRPAEGVTPTTAEINVLTHGPAPARIGGALPSGGSHEGL